MRGVTDQEQPPVLHGLDNEAAHGCHAALQDGPSFTRQAAFDLEAPVQFLPDALIGPLCQILVGSALEIRARDVR